MALNFSYRRGFTIVELLVVIVVIAILAAIVTVAYNGVRRSAEISTLSNEIRTVSQQLEYQRTLGGIYPISLGSIKKSDAYQYGYNATDTTYCLSLKKGEYQYRVSNTNQKIEEGVCTVGWQSFATSYGDFTLALSSQNSLYAWGSNWAGMLGNGTTNDSIAPVNITSSGALAGKTITAVSAGESHGVALSSDGRVYAWGSNSSGQLGDGTTANRSSPVAVNVSGVLAGKTVTAIATGRNHTLALTSDGRVYAWGENMSGQLGNGSNANSSVPVAVTMTGVLSGKTVSSIAANYYYSGAVTSDGRVYTWGGDDEGGMGSLGHATIKVSNVPVAVDVSGALSGKTVSSMAFGPYHGIVLTSDGRAYTWGANMSGELGRGNTTSSDVPVAVSTSGVLSGKTLSAVSAGYFSSVALATDGNIYSWGNNTAGALGNGSTTDSTVPVTVTKTGTPATGKTFSKVFAKRHYAVAIASDDTAYSWGDNGSGQLGDGTSTGRTTPVQIPNM